MLSKKIKKFVLIVFIFVTIHLFFQFWLYAELSVEEALLKNKTNILIWWTPFIPLERVKNCGNSVCIFTSNRSISTHPNLKGFLFYGSHFNQSDLPLPRNGQIWGLFHEESPRNVPILSHEDALSLFNFSSTFSRFSNIPLTLQYLPFLENITDRKYFKTFETKTQNDLASIIYIQTDCSTPNNRDTYVQELMKYIKIDSYGQCLNNKNISESLQDSMGTMMSSEMMELISNYKFTISFENSICEDYITEKIWRPIIAGSLPIYIGSPSIKDWLPNEKTAIFPSEFESPKHLSEYLIFLTNNKTAYNEYFKHKIKGEIQNEKLIKNHRIIWPEYGLGIVDDFECFICQNLNIKNIVDKKHYDCPEPISVVNNQKNISNWWLGIYKRSKCEAIALKKFVEITQDKTEQFEYNILSQQTC